MKQTYRYLLFDLDGTLTDPKEGITKSIQYGLKHYGIEITDLDALSPLIGPPLMDSFEKHFGFGREGAWAVLQKYREYYTDTGIYENTLYDGIIPLLKTLKDQGKTILLATSKATVYAKRILEHFDLMQYFTFVGGSELDGSRSEKAEVIRYVFEQVGITDLSEAVMIGDREYDVIGAKKTGITSIGLLTGYGSKEELSAAGADYIVNNFEELLHILL